MKEETPEEIVKMEVAMRLSRAINQINNLPEYDFDHQTQRREMITEVILKAMQEYSSIQVKAVKQVLREEFLLNTQNYPREYHALFEEKFNRAMKEFESLNTKP